MCSTLTHLKGMVYLIDMAAKKTAKSKAGKTTSASTYGEPKYPYTWTPASLRRFLDQVPTKPKPEKVTPPTLKAWGFKNTNDKSILRVLKSLELLSSSGEPTVNYIEYMSPDKGPASLGRQIRKVYGTLFSHVSNPGSANQEELRNFFNTYGGGGEEVVRLQIQTFKALAEHATFGAADPLEKQERNASGASETTGNSNAGRRPDAAVRIDPHIHLPENKTKAEYDSILESIAKHIYQQDV
jgi:Family of unknown function (DUF5343)